MSTELFEAIGKIQGLHLRIEWGEPDADGFYTPLVIRTDEEYNRFKGLHGADDRRYAPAGSDDE